MKYLIFSDLHGSAKQAEFLIQVFLKEKCDQMICLGDVLYHGPRNDLPEFYAPKQVALLLNAYQDKITCIQGNCDAEVDQMVLNFKLLKQKNMNINGIYCHLEHGHHLKEYNQNYDAVLFGHTHVPTIEIIQDTVYLNPGSITLPKYGKPASYMLWDNRAVKIYDIMGNILLQYQF